MSAFWDLFEKHLAANVAAAPSEYMLPAGATPAEGAALVRRKMQATGMRGCNHNSKTFRQVAKSLGIKPTRAALEAAEKKAG